MSLWEDLTNYMTENPLDTIEGLAGLYSLFDSSQRAADADKDFSEYTAEQIARDNQIYSLFAEGGETVRNNMKRLLEEYGSFGQITPELIDTFTERFATARAEQDASNKSTIEGMEQVDKDRYIDLEDAFREYVATAFGRAGEEVYAADAAAIADSKGGMDYAQMTDEIAQTFYDIRSRNSQRTMDETYARAVANLPAGMENSTLAVQMQRSMADMAKQQADADLLASINDAQTYIGGLQTTASNEQNITNADRNMARTLLADKYGISETQLNQLLSGGKYGAGMATDLNNIGMNAITELGAMYGLEDDTAYSDFIRGLEAASTESGVATDYISKIVDMTLAPYEFTASGSAAINTSGTMNALSTSASNASKLADANAAGFGDWLSDINV